MTKAVRIHAQGGPEMLRWEDVPLPEPGPGEARLHHEAIGVNFIDVYYRTGLYRVPDLPATLGMEGAGIVTAIGPGVTQVAVGDRVAYAGGPLGGYATDRVIPADRLVRLPDGIGFETAAAMMMRGIEAIGVVSSAAKAETALANGAAHAVVGHASLGAEVKRLTGGGMVKVVYDSVGKDTFTASLDCLAPLGLMVSFGNASGPVPPVDIGMLGARGSLFLTRPSLAHYTAKRPDLLRTAEELFAVVENGAVRIQVNQRFPLADVADAHRALEGRRTTGSTVLIP